MRQLLNIAFALALSAGCYPELIPPADGNVDYGWAAEYVATDRLLDIRLEADRCCGPYRIGRVVQGGGGFSPPSSVAGRAGRTYVLDTLLGVYAMVDYDLAQGRRGRPVSFVSVPGARSLTGRADSLVVSNIDDLVILDWSDLSEVIVRRRLEGAAGAYPFPDEVPPETLAQFGGLLSTPYFTCFDESRGTLLGWRLDNDQDFECYRE